VVSSWQCSCNTCMSIISHLLMVVGGFELEQMRITAVLMSDVNIAFRQAAHEILLDNEALLQHFTLELKSHDAGRYWNRI